MSQVFHEVLQIVVSEMLESGKDWKDLSPREAEELVRTYSAAVAQRIRGEVMLGSARSQYLLQRIERTLGQVIASVKEMLARGAFRPTHTGVTFGDTGRLPAYTVKTPSGAEARLSGQIDRVDVVAEGNDAGAVAVFDYRLGGNMLSVGSLYHGLSLQLLTYLLVLESSGQQLAGRPVTPAAAFYFQLLRGFQNVEHPDDAADPNDPLYHLRHKPRGLFDGRFLTALDRDAAAGEASKVVNGATEEGRPVRLPRPVRRGRRAGVLRPARVRPRPPRPDRRRRDGRPGRRRPVPRRPDHPLPPLRVPPRLPLRTGGERVSPPRAARAHRGPRQNHREGRRWHVKRARERRRLWGRSTGQPLAASHSLQNSKAHPSAKPRSDVKDSAAGPDVAPPAGSPRNGRPRSSKASAPSARTSWSRRRRGRARRRCSPSAAPTSSATPPSRTAATWTNCWSSPSPRRPPPKCSGRIGNAILRPRRRPNR